MDMADVIRQHPKEDENFKVIKMLTIRLFNAFGASLNLMLSGYIQNATLIMRDTLETIFLLDLFSSDYTSIEQWRFADKNEMKKKFSPAAVRKYLDTRDGFTEKKREATYKMFSDLAGHPNMHSQHMMRPLPGEDIVMGPFMEKTALTAGLEEMAKLAVQAGEIMSKFIFADWYANEGVGNFVHAKKEWIETFYKTRDRQEINT